MSVKDKLQLYGVDLGKLPIDITFDTHAVQHQQNKTKHTTDRNQNL